MTFIFKLSENGFFLSQISSQETNMSSNVPNSDSPRFSRRNAVKIATVAGAAGVWELVAGGWCGC